MVVIGIYQRYETSVSLIITVHAVIDQFSCKMVKKQVKVLKKFDFSPTFYPKNKNKSIKRIKHFHIKDKTSNRIWCWTYMFAKVTIKTFSCVSGEKLYVTLWNLVTSTCNFYNLSFFFCRCSCISCTTVKRSEEFKRKGHRCFRYRYIKHRKSL